MSFFKNIVPSSPSSSSSSFTEPVFISVFIPEHKILKFWPWQARCKNISFIVIVTRLFNARKKKIHNLQLFLFFKRCSRAFEIFVIKYSNHFHWFMFPQRLINWKIVQPFSSMLVNYFPLKMFSENSLKLNVHAQ